MKKLYLIVAFLLTSLCGYAQQIPLNDYYKQGTSWCEVEFDPRFNAPTEYCFLNFTIGGDTIVNGNTYHLVYATTYHTKPEGWIPLDKLTLLGGIRTTAEQVYFIKLNHLHDKFSYFYAGYFKKIALYIEVMIYDYSSFKEGDEIIWVTRKYKVGAKQQIQFSNGQYGEKIPLTTTAMFVPQSYIIKGVGSPEGFFSPLTYNNHTLNSNYYAMEYHYSNPQFNYTFPTPGHTLAGSHCWPVSVGQIEAQPAFSIYPNPATDIITIESPGIAQLLITDITGKVLHTTRDLPAGKHTLQTPEQPGIYLLQAQMKDGSLVNRKIVRQ